MSKRHQVFGSYVAYVSTTPCHKTKAPNLSRVGSIYQEAGCIFQDPEFKVMGIVRATANEYFLCAKHLCKYSVHIISFDLYRP